MQAVIIAGGYGTRLRPLTYTRPKPLIPLLNRPMILHILNRLPREIIDVILPVNYMIEQMYEYFQRNDVGRTVRIVEETKPLGTGGAIKNIEELLEDRFLVFNGDVISSVNVTDMLKKHEETGGVASIALWEVEDPSAFGAIDLCKGNRITKFVEKPKKGEAPSNLINAGVYVFENEVLKYIPAKKQVSIEREVFPKLIKKGMYGFKFEGYWADAGTLQNYIRAMKMLLASEGSSINRSVKFSTNAKIEKPVNIGPRCNVNGRIGPNVALGADCIVHSSTISDSALFDSDIIHKNTIIKDSIIGDRCRIGPRTTIVGSIIGDGAHIKANQTITDKKVMS